MTGAALRCKKFVSMRVSASVIHNAVVGLFVKAMDMVLFATFTCILALGLLCSSIQALLCNVTENNPSYDMCAWCRRVYDGNNSRSH